MNVLVVSFVVIVSLGSSVLGQDTCFTPDNDPGTCIDIRNCQILLTLLTTRNSDPQVRYYLRQSTCGYVGRYPKVCCPDMSGGGGEPEVSTMGPTQVTRQPVSTTEPNQDMRQPVSNQYSLPSQSECGYSNVTNARVVGGVAALLGEFPWMVELGYRNYKNPSQTKWLCGGSLITKKHILTAAHCVYNRNDLYLARLGELDLYSNDDGADPVDIELVNAKIHEDYNRSDKTNDIAILTLAKEVDRAGVWPVCLPVEEPYRSMDYVRTTPKVAGWGSLYFNGPQSTNLQEVALPVVQNSECNRVFGRSAIIDNRIICAGYLQGGKDSCKGDSGGPLMHSVNNELDRDGETVKVYQIGIVSFGFRCAEEGYPGVYTRVTAFIEWIKRNLN